ncbi:DUF4350 domain-containing protein [Natrinema thermotolerans]|uniref:DUF4350 domain-containing protein n=1 Tax=Natrinema thermotolerans TaxID=121872 RepID=A0AAF0PF66_9EURY|nr:DUF4350 domain-containing protein [Natrinema thermotolerans]QCC60469.1 DUF4350 domain-containing protein [Natrinema thermotolerans]QCC61370.1 DUF4350 domain-containing protein [Natrinema thermotolerans]WMT07503.1 DUF4350 domain-containing protein [Natrinema thermotolerans]WMT08135.1 DUF4350 domain-containing protein [Natrinema thermotolerans]
MSWHAGVLDGDGVDWPRLLLAGLVLSLLLALVIAAATSSAAFGPYNPSWEGSSELRGDAESAPGVETHLLRDTAEYEELPATETVAFVIAPEEPYEGEDVARLREFVANGGTLVVLENFGEPGNALLADVGAQARVDGQLLRDQRHHYQGPAMPVANEVGNHSLTDGVDQLTLNYGTAVEPGNATVLVSTSGFTYLGPEGDDLDEQDELRSYPVATVESVGDGRVVVVGDPSVTINAMYDEPDNAAFVRGLYADADHVVFDRSHGGPVPPLLGAVLTLRDSPPLQLFVGGLGIGVVAALSRGRPRTWLEGVRARLPARFRPVESSEERPSYPGLSDAERAEFLRRRHPDWDEERIQRVITALNHPRSEGGTDE